MSHAASAIASIRIAVHDASRGSILKFKADRAPVAFVLMTLIVWVVARRSPARVNRLFRRGQLVSGGFVALTHGMAISLGPLGIRVNSISPGWIETRGKNVAHSRRDRLQHPVGRVGKPEDVADACFYLVEQAGFMTGQNITLDGGMTVKMIYEA